MRKLLMFLFAAGLSVAGFSQVTTKPVKKIVPRDHFLLQFAANSWHGEADSVESHEKGFNRSFNAALMFDNPFKTNPHLSIAFGIGVTNADIYFTRMTLNITGTGSTLPFVAADTGNRFKKYKLNESFLEVPLEFRFFAKPSDLNKSIKAAVGIKIGTLANVHTKAKTLENSAGKKLNDVTLKESSRSYFNTTRFAVTARVGYGIFSVFGAYNVTNVFKDGVAPDTKLLQVGLTISGL